jgi:hypothetical protein
MSKKDLYFSYINSVFKEMSGVAVAQRENECAVDRCRE